MFSIKDKMIQPLKLAAMAAVVLSLAACSVTDTKTTTEEVTSQDLEMAAHIMGRSLSAQNGGLIASIYDATADINSEGLGYDTRALKNSGSPEATQDSSGRGGEKGWSYSYDPETGTHTIIFYRNVYRGEYSKSVDVKYEYIFKDTEGKLIQHPRRNKDFIATEDFTGYVSGVIAAPKHNRTFTKADTLYFGGLEDGSPIVTLEGNHHGEGEMTRTRRNGNEISRTYLIDAEFVDVKLEKEAIITNDNLEAGVTGTILYSIVLTKTTDGSTHNVTIGGTIEMNGDGSALLRFKKHNRFFIIYLSEGDVKD